MTNEQIDRGIEYCEREVERFKKMFNDDGKTNSPTYVGLYYSLNDLLKAMKEPQYDHTYKHKSFNPIDPSKGSLSS